MATVLFGTVKDNVDTEGLGRIQVALADHGEEVLLPWIRVVQSMASSGAGMVWLPEIDDNVVVLAGGAGPETMVVLGALYSGNRLPPGEAKVEHKHILTPAGNSILIDDTEGAEQIIISTKDATLQILLDHAGPEITITAGDNLIINAEADVTVNADNVDVLAGSNVTIAGDTEISIEGGNVKIDGSSVKITGNVELG